MPKIVDHDHKRKMIAETAWFKTGSFNLIMGLRVVFDQTFILKSYSK
ncbi:MULTISPECIES: hypothetical protein [Bacillaceae]|uniref:Uncharacterized protein n=1 Tax=Ornithinibacillus massiliensis TaxID=1944633 RepID=A0ABS5MFT4_9BACI|nr:MULTISPECIES: hypothetical protein [Bacillaceae]MBS3681192.1 hypothetical protein [Ornithinibacillus massiliensis]